MDLFFFFNLTKPWPMDINKAPELQLIAGAPNLLCESSNSQGKGTGGRNKPGRFITWTEINSDTTCQTCNTPTLPQIKRKNKRSMSQNAIILI